MVLRILKFNTIVFLLTLFFFNISNANEIIGKPYIVDGDTIKINNFSPGVAINIGNPHVVFFGKNIDQVDLASIGPTIEKHNLFPNKTNVEIIEIINDQKINMRVWERGAGLTLACGSGACASVYAGQLKKLLGNDVEVQLERGSLFITIDKGEAIMTGLAEISFRGNIEV